MGKKIRDKKKKEKPRKKIPQTRKKKGKTKPETITKKVIKSGTENELEKELEKLNQANKYNPTKNINICRNISPTLKIFFHENASSITAMPNFI